MVVTMKLTFYCRECIKLGCYVGVRWTNLIDFLGHVERIHGIQLAERSE